MSFTTFFTPQRDCSILAMLVAGDTKPFSNREVICELLLFAKVARKAGRSISISCARMITPCGVVEHEGRRGKGKKDDTNTTNIKQLKNIEEYHGFMHWPFWATQRTHAWHT